MIPHARGALPDGLAETMDFRESRGGLSSARDMIVKTLVATELEVRKIRHDRTALITRAVQPALWLLVFGQVFTRVKAIPTGNLPYLDFMTPGILAQSVLFISIFHGISVIWERDLGIVHKLLVSPAPRAALVLGKGLSGGVRSVFQAVVVMLLALVLGVNLNFHPLNLAAVILMVVLGACLFSTLSLIMACIVKTRERFMGIGQVLTMPLFFASNALYPIGIMPEWLQVLSRANPLTYLVEALRSLMLPGGSPSIQGLGLDIAVLLGVQVLLLVIAARLYPKLAV